MTPKIDYILLGKAVEHYRDAGYKYVEVPWAVERSDIEATLAEGLGYRLAQGFLGCGPGDKTLSPMTDGGWLVGSAEQGFLSLDLPPGKYVGVTPCFRVEPVNDLFYQDWFMKVELYVVGDKANVKEVLDDARGFFGEWAEDTEIEIVETEIGYDLMIEGIEIGSYGDRSIETDNGIHRWTYGTGLALPRFSVAQCLSKMLIDG